jgi:hypothetical protein
MAESIHAKAGNEVKILLAVEVEKKDSLAAFDSQRVAVYRSVAGTVVRAGSLPRESS